MMAKARLSKKGSRQSKRHGKLQFSSQKEMITGKNHTKIKKPQNRAKQVNYDQTKILRKKNLFNFNNT